MPREVVDTVSNAWREVIARSDARRKYVKSRGALFDPSAGEEAHRRAWPAVQSNARLLHEAGKSKVPPDRVGIPRP